MASRKHSQTELEALVADLQTLLASKQLDDVPEIKAFRERVDEGLQSARDRAVEAAQDAAERAREAARAADAYAHDEPWRIAGAALAVGALLGFLLGRR
jgi:ElaB/YqjD/DUF883 family membrane-anchored ribosome-binding protein